MSLIQSNLELLLYIVPVFQWLLRTLRPLGTLLLSLECYLSLSVDRGLDIDLFLSLIAYILTESGVLSPLSPYRRGRYCC